MPAAAPGAAPPPRHDARAGTANPGHPGAAGRFVNPRYFLAVVGTAGDLHPFLSLGTALRRLGRPVTVITHAHHRAAVARAGLVHAASDTEADWDRILARPGIWHPTRSFEALLEAPTYEDGLERVLGHLEAVPADPASPRVLLSHPVAVPAGAIARARGHAEHLAAVWLAPSNLKTCHGPLQLGPLPMPAWLPPSWRRALWNWAEARYVDPVLLPQMNAVRGRRGLPPLPSWTAHMTTAPEVSLTLFPEWFGPVRPDWPRPLLAGEFPLFDPAAGDPLPAAVETFLAAGPAPVVFLPGSANLHAAEFFGHALAASARLGVRALLLTPEPGQVPQPLPPWALWQPYVALARLLPHTAALVHHGGIGTTAEALRAGVPQVVTPFAWDQFDNGARVEALGAGRVCAARWLGFGRLARSLGAVLGAAAMRQRCAQLARHFPPPRDMDALVRALERELGLAAA